MKTSDTYTTAHVQELVDQILQRYTFEHAPPPNNENINPNIIPQDTANSVTMDEIQVMFKQFMETNKPKKDKDKDTDKNKNPLVYKGVDSEGFPITYYRTHEITKNLRYNSMIYKRTCEGHKNESSLQNKMGESLETAKKRDWLIGNTSDKINQVSSYSEVLSRYNNCIQVEQHKFRPLVADTAATGTILEEDTVDQKLHSTISVINLKPPKNVI